MFGNYLRKGQLDYYKYLWSRLYIFTLLHISRTFHKLTCHAFWLSMCFIYITLCIFSYGFQLFRYPSGGSMMFIKHCPDACTVAQWATLHTKWVYTQRCSTIVLCTDSPFFFNLTGPFLPPLNTHNIRPATTSIRASTKLTCFYIVVEISWF